MIYKKVNPNTLIQKKNSQEPINCFSVYDYSTAKLVDQVKPDIILVGDSLGMVFQGKPDTLSVTTEMMIYHGKAVHQAVTHAYTVIDVPFLVPHYSNDKFLSYCHRLISETGITSIKIEGGQEVISNIQSATQAGIPVMGHLGFKPQKIYTKGGYKKFGKEDSLELKKDIETLISAGVYAIILECVEENLATELSKEYPIPMIGIGSGKGCDGKIAVAYDLLGLSYSIPKFQKEGLAIKERNLDIIKNYISS